MVGDFGKDGAGVAFPRLAMRLALVMVLGALSACSARQIIVDSVADQLAGQQQAAEDDLELAREASAFYLKLSESVLRKAPGHLPLAEAVSGGFTQYAYAFVAADAERLESRDAQGAQRLRERAARLYLRGHRHARRALEQRRPDIFKALASADRKGWPVLEKSELGVAYWAAAALGGYISLSKDDPDAVADLPLAVRLATIAWELDPGYGEGALASLMGAFEAARPGGTRARAIEYFDQGIAAGAGANAGAFVAKAEGVALPAQDRPAFEALLRQALGAAKLRRDLQNEVMRERAQRLLESADDLF
jgi:hypothetical protein